MVTGTRPLRADAARNRDKLLAAAREEFTRRGLDVPLEHVARRAGVSIGTLYNHFPTREALFGAIFPERIAGLLGLVESALDDPDPWRGFAGFMEGLCELQAVDRGLSDALAHRFPVTAEVDAACHDGFRQAGEILDRAKSAGALRPDFDQQDLVTLIWALAHVIRESADTAPDAWRRCLGFYLDGLRVTG